MATNWPTSRDTFTNPSSGDTLDSPSHAAQHANINDAVEALQAHAGLVLISTTTIGTGVSSVTVNNCFSSTFRDYRVLVSGTVNSVAYAQFEFRLASSGTPSSTAYDSRLIYSSYGSSSVLGAYVNNSSAGFLWWGGPRNSSDTVSDGVGDIDVFGPFVSGFTTAKSTSYGAGTSGGMATGRHTVSASYDGFIIKPETGTWTGGLVRVYGYNNG